MRSFYQRRYFSGNLLPGPAKQLDYFWAFGTNKHPESWPNRFEEEVSAIGSAILQLSKMPSHHATVFYNDLETYKNGPDRLADVWVFSKFWKGYSYRFFDVELDTEEKIESLCKSRISENLFSTNEVYLVCGHGNRDLRCGNRGFPIVKELRKQNRQAFICSHLGGHRFAGNVLKLPEAHWYSYVESFNTSEIFDEQLHKCSICDRGSSW